MIPDYSKKGDGAGRTADLSVANRERKRPSEIMKIVILLTLMAAAYFFARGDQHAGCASVIARRRTGRNNVQESALDFRMKERIRPRKPEKTAMAFHDSGRK
jgi:hypothetical protein